MIHLQQTREEVFQNTSKLQEKIKKIYDRKTKEENFNLGDVVLWWDARNEDKGKHGKFETYGRDHTKFLHSEERMLSCWKRWMEETIQEGRPMVGFSSTTMSKNLERSSSLYILVCILLLAFQITVIRV